MGLLRVLPWVFCRGEASGLAAHQTHEYGVEVHAVETHGLAHERFMYEALAFVEADRCFVV
jgi:hypothetical protein